MVHEQSLFKLVSAAQGGNDDALCKEIQIDRTILFLPFVKDRLIKAQPSNDETFLANLAYRLKEPFLKQNFAIEPSWITFALLEDDCLPHEQLLDVCDEGDWVCWYVMNGSSLQELMELGGWKSYEVVSRYVHLAPEHLADAAGELEGAAEL